MLIRSDYKIADIQEAVMGYLQAKITAAVQPWPAYVVVPGYPDQTVFENFTKSFFYCHMPLAVGVEKQQAAGAGRFKWELTVGGWTDREKGGSEEAAIMVSLLLAQFGNSAINSATFSGSVGGTAFTLKTFPYIGLIITGIGLPRAIEQTENDDFRGELTLQITC